jgi:hypothetical protein
MLLLLTANMIAECPRTDCNRLGDIKKKKELCISSALLVPLEGKFVPRTL